LLLTVLAVVRDRASCKRTTTTPATNMAKHTILYFDFDFCTLTFVTKTHFCRIWRVSDIADIADITRLRSTNAGRAEAPRLVMHVGGIEFEDKRFGEREEFLALKEANEFRE
jgi:hypothetical protein